MTLTISPFGNLWQNHKHNYERSIKQQLDKYYKSQKAKSTEAKLIQWALEKFCKKRYHGMIDLQPILFEKLTQDSSRHQMWNIDKLYTRKNMCIKIEKKQHMWDKGEENIHHHIYIK